MNRFASCFVVVIERLSIPLSFTFPQSDRRGFCTLFACRMRGRKNLSYHELMRGSSWTLTINRDIQVLHRFMSDHR